MENTHEELAKTVVKNNIKRELAQPNIKVHFEVLIVKTWVLVRNRKIGTEKPRNGLMDLYT